MANSGDSRMIDVAQATAESKEWGISLREWMELHAHIYGNVDAFGDFSADKEEEEGWRGRVAEVLIENHLAPKANRYVQCSRYGVRLQCKGEKNHQLFSPLYCDLRYCPRCGPRQFARLIEKYSPVLKFLASQHYPGYLLREITLTTRKTNNLSSQQIKKFNDDVKKTLKRLLKGVRNWGVIWCDEVGFNNTNLHAHILFYGPYIDQSQLAEVWREISGHQVVFITKAHVNGPKSLIHLLKYVSKPPADDPRIIGQLEVAFHGRRRVHALGVFYNFVGPDTDNLNGEWKTCPHCGAELIRLPGTVRIEKLILEGRTFVGIRNTERKRKWVN
jgi:ribosomal protein S27AE